MGQLVVNLLAICFLSAFATTSSTKQGLGLNPRHTGLPRKAASIKPSDEHYRIRKIFFINRDTDVDRRRNIVSQLKSFAGDIPFQRVAGVSPEQLSFHPKRNELMPRGCCDGKWTDECETTSTELNPEYHLRSCCCDFAHRLAYEAIAAQPDKDAFFLVVEDDVEFSPRWLHEFYAAAQSIPSDWEILRLGFIGTPDPSGQDRIGDGIPWRLAKPWGERGDRSSYWGAHAVLLTPNKASVLLERIKGMMGDYADKFTRPSFARNYVLESSPISQSNWLGSPRYISQDN